MIDKEVRMNEAKGTTGSHLITRMAGYLPDLQRIWISCTSEQFEMLCQAYPGFARYAALVESIGKGEVQKEASQPALHSLESDGLRQRLASMIAEATAIEAGFQSILEAGKPAGWRLLASELFIRFSAWSGSLAHIRKDFGRGLIPVRLRASVLLMERRSRQLDDLAAKVRGR